MDKPKKKFSALINAELEPGIVANTVLHLGTQLGALAQEIGGTWCRDASGGIHAGLPVFPNVILAATQDQLQRCAKMAQAMVASNNLIVLDYPEQGYSTATEAEYHDAIAGASSDQIIYYGLLFFGDRRIVNKITSGLSLWTGRSTDT